MTDSAHMHATTTRGSGRPRVAKVPWHTGHDYELSKLPIDLFLLGDTHRRWSVDQRPVPPNVTFVDSGSLPEIDMMILHVDQWSPQEIDKRTLFLRTARMSDVPKVVLNHGCNMVDGCTSAEMRAFVGDKHVVCNSSTANRLWKLPDSRFIRHGMSPDEWPQSNYGRQNIIVTQPNSALRAAYRNFSAIKQFEESSGIRIEWVGRDFRFGSFEKYRSFLATSSIYFNASHASPNPRARTEAMFCGLVPVTTDSHGESEYIENGVNGFASNDLSYLYEALKMLKADPAMCSKMGVRARETAADVFHINRFIDQWDAVFSSQLG